MNRDKEINEFLIRIMSECHFLNFQFKDSVRGYGDGREIEVSFTAIAKPEPIRKSPMSSWGEANMYIDGKRMGKVEEVYLPDINRREMRPAKEWDERSQTWVQKERELGFNPSFNFRATDAFSYQLTPYMRDIMKMQADDEVERYKMLQMGIDPGPRDVIIRKGQQPGPTESSFNILPPKMRGPNNAPLMSLEDIIKAYDVAHLKVFGTKFPWPSRPVKNPVEKKAVEKKKVKKPIKKRKAPGGQLVFGSAASAQRLRGREVKFSWLDDMDT